MLTNLFGFAISTAVIAWGGLTLARTTNLPRLPLLLLAVVLIITLGLFVFPVTP